MFRKLTAFLGATLLSTSMVVRSYFTGSPKDNFHLVEHLMNSGIIKSQEVAAVMRSVDRGSYTQYSPYDDSPQPIGFQATISAPHMHAFALEYLKDHLKKGKKALDVGSGSGYLTVCFAKMMETPGALAYGVEHIPALVSKSIKNIENNDKELLESGKVVIVEGDGRLGLKEHAPYDAIHVGAGILFSNEDLTGDIGAEEIPKELLDQLAKGGRMLIPVGRYGNQEFLVIDKDEEGKVTKQKTFDVRYVPLTDRKKQWSEDL